MDILARSEHYFIQKEYEEAVLYLKEGSKRIACVGDHYGDPADAYIDPQERFCIVVGCGIIRYNLKEPFEDYSYDKKTTQWMETGRTGDILWCDHIEDVTESYVAVSLDGKRRGEFDLKTLERVTDIKLNSSAKELFDTSLIDDIEPDLSYPVRMMKDPFGRVFFGVGNFCGTDMIKEDTDLSWMEWDGNEVYLDGEDRQLLFEKAIAIMKGWKDLLIKGFPEDRFVIFASYDNGECMDEEDLAVPSFTLRLWKKRDGQGLDENADFDQPVIRWSN